MTLIKLSADDLAALRDGKIIERPGGPTVKIVLASAYKIDVVSVLVGGEES